MTVGGNGGCVVENWHGMVGVGATKAFGSHLSLSAQFHMHYSITSHSLSLCKVFEAASAGKNLIFLKKGF